MRHPSGLVNPWFTMEVAVWALMVSGFVISALVLVLKTHARNSMRAHLDQKHRDRIAAIQRAGRRAQQTELAKMQEIQEGQKHLAQIRLWRETQQDEQP